MLQHLPDARRHQTDILQRCAQLIEQGQLKPLVSKILPLEQAAMVHALVEDGPVQVKNRTGPVSGDVQHTLLSRQPIAICSRVGQSAPHGWPPVSWKMKKLLLPCCLATTLYSSHLPAEEPPLQLARLEQGAHSAHSPAAGIWASLNPKKLQLRSAAALVLDDDGNEVYAKDADLTLPIASITKLMTAMVILDAGLPLQEKIRIAKDDRDLIQLTGSRLMTGATLPRKQLLQLALMSSENRAANALARSWPQGKNDFVQAMNAKAAALGMYSSRFTDPAGLDAGNVATPHDIAKMVRAALQYPLIRKATTTRSISVYPWKGRGPLRYSNTNRLLKNTAWDIQLSKTGYLNEAGRCLVMQVEIAGQPLVIVLLNSFGKLTPFGDSNRIRKWIERGTGS